MERRPSWSRRLRRHVKSVTPESCNRLQAEIFPAAIVCTNSCRIVRASGYLASMPLRPLPHGSTRISGGFWLERQRTNRHTTIPAAAQRLEEAGTLRNFRRTAGQETGADASTEAAFAGKLFADTDVYKW